MITSQPDPFTKEGRNKVAQATVVLVFPTIWHHGGLGSEVLVAQTWGCNCQMFKQKKRETEAEGSSFNYVLP